MTTNRRDYVLTVVPDEFLELLAEGDVEGAVDDHVGRGVKHHHEVAGKRGRLPDLKKQTLVLLLTSGSP